MELAKSNFSQSALSFEQARPELLPAWEFSLQGWYPGGTLAVRWQVRSLGRLQPTQVQVEGFRWSMLAQENVRLAAPSQMVILGRLWNSCSVAAHRLQVLV